MVAKPEECCEHVAALKKFLDEKKLRVYGELTEMPRGWVNVSCSACGQTCEVKLTDD